MNAGQLDEPQQQDDTTAATTTTQTQATQEQQAQRSVVAVVAEEAGASSTMDNSNKEDSTTRKSAAAIMAPGSASSQAYAKGSSPSHNKVVELEARGVGLALHQNSHVKPLYEDTGQPQQQYSQHQRHSSQADQFSSSLASIASSSALRQALHLQQQQQQAPTVTKDSHNNMINNHNNSHRLSHQGSSSSSDSSSNPALVTAAPTTTETSANNSGTSASGSNSNSNNNTSSTSSNNSSGSGANDSAGSGNDSGSGNVVVNPLHASSHVHAHGHSHHTAALHAAALHAYHHPHQHQHSSHHYSPHHAHVHPHTHHSMRHPVQHPQGLGTANLGTLRRDLLASSKNTSDSYGLPRSQVNEEDRLPHRHGSSHAAGSMAHASAQGRRSNSKNMNPHIVSVHPHHATTVVARMPPPDSQSSLSSSGNDEGGSGLSSSSTFGGGNMNSTKGGGPAYHNTIINKQTLQHQSMTKKKNKKNKSISGTGSVEGNKKKKSMKKKVPPETTTTTSSEESSGDPTVHALPKRHHHAGTKKRPHPSSSNSSSGVPTKEEKDAAPSMAKKKRVSSKQQQQKQRAAAAEEDENSGSNSSSGSGTEAGYAGSASSNDNAARKPGEETSNSSFSGNSSSDIPDFSSGASESNVYAFGPSNSPSLSSSNGDDDSEDISSEDDRKPAAVPRASTTATAAASSSHQQPASAAAMLPPPSAGVPSVAAMPQKSALAVAQSHFAKVSKISSSSRTSGSKPTGATTTAISRRPSYASRHPRMNTAQLKDPQADKPPIMSIGSDLMAHVLTFLEPPDILRVLTMPLSKDWQLTFAGQQELWRVLCLLDPFKAQVEEDAFSSSSASSSSGSDDDGSLSSFSISGGDNDATISKKRSSRSSIRRMTKMSKYRLLYTSFVRCMTYLARVKEDVLHGRPPSMIDHGGSSIMSSQSMRSSRSLQQFLAGARGVVELHQQHQEHVYRNRNRGSDTSNAGDSDAVARQNEAAGAAQGANFPILSVDDGSSSYQSSGGRRRKRKKNREQRRTKRPKYGRSMLTDRLLAPAANGEVNPDNVTLPWSCALYSVVNWMVAFSDVEGIQIMCLKVLPYLLEDEQQRITAQRVGLTDVILRGMVLFQNSVQLHTASFHTLVLLARPLGGREGMLFHSSMVNAAGIFSGARNGPSAAVVGNGGEESMFSGGAQSNGKNGIAVMLDSMRRFEDDEALQAMSCWSLVNIALAPVQKEVLVKLGGIEVTTNAMMRHPHNAEVQFRALFALINLVIPSVNVTEENNNNNEEQDNPDDVNGGISEELDEAVSQIANLVVVAMKNFCSSEAILNRACLVLHNLSLTADYHTTLLWTPNCYQMLEWCLANYRTDQVLQQSAAGTLHRLQVTLSNDDNLRARFAASIQAQQQLSLEAAHREAIQIYEQQEQLRRESAAGGGGE